MTQNSVDENDAVARAAQWRDDFDQSFVRAPEDGAHELDDYLAIRAGSGSYALRLAEVAGLQTLASLTPCPTRRAELLGLSSFRGNVLPVYDLRVLLGAGSSANGQTAPAWWVAIKEAPLGLAFDVFERHLRLPADAIARADSADSRLYTGETLRFDGALRPIVSIRSILLDVQEMTQQQSQTQT